MNKLRGFGNTEAGVRARAEDRTRAHRWPGDNRAWTRPILYV